jgi:uncharacterized protein YjbI with pentapeptide repeats
MALTFSGKYSFGSTNTNGEQVFLTLMEFGQEDQDKIEMPAMNAKSVGSVEQCITYDTGAGTIIQLGSLQYLSLLTPNHWIGLNPDRGKAVVFQVSTAGEVETWSAEKIDGTVAKVNYTVDKLSPVLTLNSGPGSLNTFAAGQITPPLSQILLNKDGRGLNLRNVDLTGADLSGIGFTGAVFTGATLDRAKFKGAILTNATFVEASLDGTDLSGVKTLDRAVFTGLNLTKVVWGQGVRARCAHFERCVGSGVRIDSADFTGAHFDGADFTGASLSNACLVRAHMMGGVFVGANFDGAHLNGALLGGTSEAVAANLSYAYMPNVILSGANLFGVSFAFSSLFGAATQADALTAEQADFSNAYLEGVHFTSTPLRGSRFDNACLVSVDFTGADLTPTLAGSVRASLAGACLHGAIFTGSKLANADFAGATVAFERGHIDTRYCTPQGPFPPPPDCERLNYRKTTGLDLVSLQPTTICPNGNTVEANQKQGICLTQMLTIKHPATAWFPIGCAPASPDDASPR